MACDVGAGTSVFEEQTQDATTTGVDCYIQAQRATEPSSICAVIDVDQGRYSLQRGLTSLRLRSDARYAIALHMALRLHL